MKFSKAQFCEGMNVTVRRGQNWYKKGLVPGNKFFAYGDYIGSPSAVVECVGIMLIPFLLIPDPLLTYHHDEQCSSLLGLEKVMRKLYPGFQTNELVTVVIFNMEEEPDAG